MHWLKQLSLITLIGAASHIMPATHGAGATPATPDAHATAASVAQPFHELLGFRTAAEITPDQVMKNRLNIELLKYQDQLRDNPTKVMDEYERFAQIANFLRHPLFLPAYQSGTLNQEFLLRVHQLVKMATTPLDEIIDYTKPDQIKRCIERLRTIEGNDGVLMSVPRTLRWGNTGPHGELTERTTEQTEAARRLTQQLNNLSRSDLLIEELRSAVTRAPSYAPPRPSEPPIRAERARQASQAPQLAIHNPSFYERGADIKQAPLHLQLGFMSKSDLLLNDTSPTVIRARIDARVNELAHDRYNPARCPIEGASSQLALEYDYVRQQATALYNLIDGTPALMEFYREYNLNLQNLATLSSLINPTFDLDGNANPHFDLRGKMTSDHIIGLIAHIDEARPQLPLIDIEALTKIISCYLKSPEVRNSMRLRGNNGLVWLVQHATKHHYDQAHELVADVPFCRRGIDFRQLSIAECFGFATREDLVKEDDHATMQHVFECANRLKMNRYHHATAAEKEEFRRIKRLIVHIAESKILISLYHDGTLNDTQLKALALSFATRDATSPLEDPRLEAIVNLDDPATFTYCKRLLTQIGKAAHTLNLNGKSIKQMLRTALTSPILRNSVDVRGTDGVQLLHDKRSLAPFPAIPLILTLNRPLGAPYKKVPVYELLGFCEPADLSALQTPAQLQQHCARLIAERYPARIFGPQGDSDECAYVKQIAQFYSFKLYAWEKRYHLAAAGTTAVTAALLYRYYRAQLRLCSQDCVTINALALDASSTEKLIHERQQWHYFMPGGVARFKEDFLEPFQTGAFSSFDALHASRNQDISLIDLVCGDEEEVAVE